MIVLLVIGLLAGVATALAGAPSGISTSILLAPMGASTAVAILACLRNLDTTPPSDATPADIDGMSAHHL